MPVYRAQATLPYQTALPRDVTTNTFHFQTLDPATTTQFEAMADGVIDFYTGVRTGGIKVSDLLSGFVQRSVPMATVRIVDVASPTPRPILHEQYWTVPPINGSIVATITNQPNEVAIVLSMFTNPVAGVPAGRQRNRIYVGPLNRYGQGTGTTTEPPRVGINQATTLLDAGEALYDSVLLESVDWVVYSGTQASASGPDNWPVYRLRVNDEYDTQRRRQPDVTTAWERFTY